MKILSLISCIFLFWMPLQAKTLIVTSEEEFGPGSLRDQVNEATPGDTIRFASSVHLITLVLDEIKIDKDLKIIGNGKVTISGNNNNRIFFISSRDSIVEIQKLNFYLGNEHFLQGGGAIGNNGILSISKCNFTENWSEFGGVIFNTGTLTIKKSNFVKNAAATQGGAIFNRGFLRIEKTNFDENGSGLGGAIVGFSNSAIHIKKSSFNKGEAEEGAGIWSEGYLHIKKTCFTNNTSTIAGGAIFSGGVLAIENASFLNNDSDIDGGAIYIAEGIAKVGDSYFKENYAQNRGGAIYNKNEITVKFSKFVRNSADNDGGAVYNELFYNDIQNDYFDNDPNPIAP